MRSEGQSGLSAEGGAWYAGAARPMPILPRWGLGRVARRGVPTLGWVQH